MTGDAPDRAAPPTRRAFARPDGRLVAGLLTLLVALGPISTDLYLPALPGIGQALGADVATTQLTLSVFLAGFALGQLVYGPLSDRFGRRPVILAGVSLYATASIACALAPSIEALIVFRFLQAVGACSGPVLARAVVRDVHAPAGAAQVLAYISMAMALAPALGPILGGVLTVAFGWRATFWALVLAALVLLALVALVLGETNRHRDPTATRPARIARNFRHLLSRPRFLAYCGVVAFAYSGIFAFISGSSFLFIDVMGLTPDLFGLCFATIVVGYMLGTLGSGRFTRRLGIDRMIRLGAAVSLAGGTGLLALALALPPGVPAVLGPFFVFMVGAGLMLPNGMAGAVGPFPTMAGAASSVMGFLQMGTGALVGVAVGHLSDGTAVPLAAAVFAVAVAALACRLVLDRLPEPAGTAA
jgi:DHA1 family bicyclomycin/chloramphenicol resistance-like MFS transporter